jgi:hypothetical protein
MIPYATICVLSGAELPTTEMLKIDKTILSELVIEETGKSPLEEDRDETVASEEEPNTEETGEDENIYDFLRKAEETSISIKDEDASSSESTNSDELKPYTDNIDYFDDHIQWLSAKIRVINLTKEIEESSCKKRYSLPILYSSII